MKVVLDASALLAYLQEEPGSQVVDEILHDASISAVNWSEVMQKSLAAGVTTNGLREDLEALGLVIRPFDANHADIAARLWQDTDKFALSLADRACLGLAMIENLPVFTTDKAWEKAKLPLKIKVIRQ